mgnify:CR=1 FL=1
MNLKNIYFSWLIYWGKMKGLLNGIAEAIILLASLASFFVLIYQFGFVQTPDSVHILERSRPFILLAFFTGITLRYVVRFQEIIQEKMLYLDISIYFLLFAVLLSTVNPVIAVFQGCHSALFALFVFPYETSLRICLIIAA